MTEHPSKTELAGYADQTLSANELLRVDTHLSKCDECYREMKEHLNIDQAGVSLAEALAGNGHDDHLTYGQLAAYVDGSLGNVEREIADVHAGACELCSAQLDDLRKINAGLTAEPVPQVLSRPDFWESITNTISLKWAVPVFAALMLVFGWIIWPTTQKKPADEVAVITNPADQHVQVPANVPEPPVDNTANANGVEPARHPAVTLVDAGGKIELDDAGNLSGVNAGRFTPALKAVLSGGDIQVSPDARKLRSSAGVLMGGGNDGVPFKLAGPVGRVVETDRPRFSWQAMAGAESYVVTIYDGNFNRVAASPALKQTSWAANTPLRRGATYKWQVTAIKDSQEIKSPVRPAPDAQFKVIDAASANEIAAAKRQTGNSHLLLGMAYAKAGLIADAEREFQALLKQNPGSEVARRLLNKVKAAR